MIGVGEIPSWPSAQDPRSILDMRGEAKTGFSYSRRVRRGQPTVDPIQTS